MAGLLSCALGRSISRRQWCGVLLLMFGSSLAEISQWNMHEEPDDNAALQQQVHIPKLTALPCLSLSLTGSGCLCWISYQTNNAVLQSSLR